jgi:tRNA(fMet)-specific endonuclease VapC
MHGAEISQFVDKNNRAVEDFTSRLDVVHYDDKAAFHYGSIRSELEKKGTPIGVNDLHIKP